VDSSFLASLRSRGPKIAAILADGASRATDETRRGTVTLCLFVPRDAISRCDIAINVCIGLSGIRSECRGGRVRISPREIDYGGCTRVSPIERPEKPLYHARAHSSSPTRVCVSDTLSAVRCEYLIFLPSPPPYRINSRRANISAVVITTSPRNADGI